MYQCFEELNLPTKLQLPVQVACDNQAATLIAKNDVNHTRTKHIDIRHHYIRQEIKSRLIDLTWVNTQKQLADIFTKGLLSKQHINLKNQLMYVNNKITKNKV